MLKALWLGLVALLALAASPAGAQARLFSQDPPLRISLTAPLTTLIRAAPTSTNPFAATLTVTDGTAPPQTFAIQLSARGMTRRTGGYCQFPPLSLKFDKASVHGTLFKGQHKLKLVTYCRPQPDYEQRIVLEYLSYRFFNLITPLSFNVRGAEVTYHNGDKDPGVTRFGFLIEDINDVADRNHLDRLTAASRQISASRLDAHAAGRAALFEYMLGNLDWEFLAGPAGVDCCHNSRFLAAPGANAASATSVIPLPYDFDYSGLVDAPYSGPPEGIPIDNLKQRYYRGYCASTAEMPAVIAEYRARRADMMALVNNEPHLNASFRAKTVRFLDQFFNLLDDPARVQSQIIKHCR